MANDNRIGRRVYMTTCHCLMYDKDNNPVELDVPIIGKPLDIARAQTKVQKQIGTKRVIIQSMDTESHYYSMLTSEFIKNADQITE